jgi:hypothetical protein
MHGRNTREEEKEDSECRRPSIHTGWSETLGTYACSCSSALRLELRHLYLDAGQLSRTASSLVLQNTIVASSFVRSWQRC